MVGDDCLFNLTRENLIQQAGNTCEKTMQMLLFISFKQDRNTLKLGKHHMTIVMQADFD